MSGHATQLAEIPVEHLVPADWNYKTDATPEQVEKLAESIRKDGSAGVLAVHELGVEVFEVIDGNHRLQAIQRLGWDEVPCENFGEISKAHAITIARRRNYQWFEDDESELAKLMRDIVSKEFDVSDLAQFMPDSPEVLEAMFDAPHQSTGTAESFDAEGAMEEAEGQEAITKPGDLWLCGAHRILCGDSTKPEDVQRLMAGQRSVLFATDPPYLVGYDGMNHPHKWNEPDKNKDWSQSYYDWDDPAQGEELYEGFIRVAVECAITEDAAWYCWHASRNQAMLEAVWNRHGAFVHQQLIWMKDRAVLTRSWYMWQHEPCFFGWIKGNRPKRIAEDYPHSVWQVPTVAPGTKTKHPTSKPIEQFETPMLQHTMPGDICYEPFLGSGSQLIAAQKTGRVCYAMEIEPRYVDVSCRRYYEYTGDVCVCTRSARCPSARHHRDVVSERVLPPSCSMCSS